MPVNEQAVDSLTINNVKTLGESTAAYSSMMLANMTAAQGRANDAANAHQQAMHNMLVEGQSQRAGHDVPETASLAPIQGQMDVLATALAQILAKIGGNTPPVTP